MTSFCYFRSRRIAYYFKHTVDLTNLLTVTVNGVVIKLIT